MDDGCPEADPEISAGSALALTLPGEWPEGGTLDAACEAVDFEPEAPFALRLSCTHPETALPAVVRLRVSGDDGQLDGLPGTSGLRVSFYNPPRGSIGCSVCNDLSIRDAAGDLILLSHSTWLFETVPEGAAVDVGGAGWLEPGSEEFESWSAPFDDLQIRNVGCAPRAALRPGAETETPLALELMADTGPVAIYDRTAERGLEVDGQRFDIIVSDAFVRGPFNCGDCPITEGVFLVLRSAR